MKKIMAIIIGLAVLTVVVLSGTRFAAHGGAKPVVVTTIYPLYEFTKQVVGNKADVVLLVPSGAEPHDWEPAAADLIKVKQASLVVYNGAGMEPWIDKISDTMLAEKKTVSAASSVGLLPAQYNEEGGPADPGTVDPHIWLDPVNAQSIVTEIAAKMTELDSSNGNYYKGNAAAYNKQLAGLDQEYSSALSAVASKEIITSHAAFGYLANRYHLKQIAIMGLSPEAEPTPERMAQIIAYIRKTDIKYIFFETLVSPKLSEVISNEAGAKTLVLNPLEGLTEDEAAKGENYITVMRTNLGNLQTALGVK